MRIVILFVLSLFFGLHTLGAQGFSGGFKAGLNFNTISGEAENEFESFSGSAGFHVGATFAYEITDLFGVKAELIYSQKGVSKNYDGPAHFFIYGAGMEIPIGGNKRGQLDIINSYIDIPVLVYHRLGPLELAAGASVGLMVNSSSSGGETFTNTIYGTDTRITFNYEGNYFRDGAGEASIISRQQEPLPGTNVLLPQVIGAYYNSDRDDPLFNRLDLGLVAELAYYLNNGLYLGARYNLGLSDITQQENDLANQLDENGQRQFRNDNDRNRSLQISIGFRL